MLSGTFSRRRALSYRAAFAEEWSRYLRARFDTPEEVAVAFAVEGSTARKWWGGEHAPSGFAVGLAFLTDPINAQEHLGGKQ